MIHGGPLLRKVGIRQDTGIVRSLRETESIRLFASVAATTALITTSLKTETGPMETCRCVACIAGRTGAGSFGRAANHPVVVPGPSANGSLKSVTFNEHAKPVMAQRDVARASVDGKVSASGMLASTGERTRMELCGYQFAILKL
jgi:hypothetical protein